MKPLVDFFITLFSDYDFCRGFWANCLPDLLVGAVLGTLLAWWIGKRLSDLERSQQRKEEKRAELERAIHYLGLLKDEIDYLINRLPDRIKAFEESKSDRFEKWKETGEWEQIRIPTPLWDIVQPSGELPKLLDPRLLASLALFYDDLMHAKGRDLIIDRLSELKQALQSRRDLPNKIDSEIQRLEAQLQTL